MCFLKSKHHFSLISLWHPSAEWTVRRSQNLKGRTLKSHNAQSVLESPRKKWLKRFWCSCHRPLRITHPIILQPKLSISPRWPHYLPAESRADINTPPLPPLKLNGALRLAWWASLMPDLLASQLYISVSAETCDTSAMMDVVLWSSDCIYYLSFLRHSACLCKKKCTRGRFFFLHGYFFDDKTDLSQLLNNYTNWLSKHCCHRCQTSANSTDANDLRSFESRHYPNLTVINEVFSILFWVFFARF